MDDIQITRIFIGWDQDRKGWRYDFNVDHGGRQFAVPILISDKCPKDDRQRYATEYLQAWVAKLAEEAAKL